MDKLNRVELHMQVNGKFKRMDIDQNTSFSFNLQASDLINPTATKIPYSTQISLPRTRVNNDMFSLIWKLDSRILNFNPLIRTDFILYINNTIYQQGYLKLEEITKKDYKIRLFGGLGDYFYTLSEVSDERDMRLKSLGMNGEVVNDFGKKFQHQIDREFVYKCWNGSTYNNLEGENMKPYFGYAMTYQGGYDNFDNSVTLNNLEEPEEVIWTNAKKSYTVNQDMTEHTRTDKSGSTQFYGEYRSYYQKPMIKVKTIIERIREKMEKEEGWETDLDSSFFNSYNPYWEDLWMILPQYDTTSDVGGLDFSPESKTMGGWYDLTKVSNSVKTVGTTYKNEIASNTGYNVIVNLPFKIQAEWVDTNNGDVIPNSRQRLRNGFSLVATLTLGSNIYSLTYKEGGSGKINLNRETVGIKRPKDFPNENKKASYYLRRIETGEKNDVDEGSIDGSVYTFTGKFNINEKTFSTSPTKMQVNVTLNGDTNWWRTGSSGKKDDRYYKVNLVFQDNAYISVATDNGDGIRSGAKVGYNDIIRSDETCYDFLISYAKIFGLHFVKEDDTKKKISIVTRNTFYGVPESLDWTYKIDYSKEKVTKPVPFDYKVGVFKWKELGTKYEEDYKSKTSKEYGSARFDTRYGFNDNEKDYLEGIIFNNCVIATDYSKYFLDRTNILYKDNKTLPYFQDASGGRVEHGFVLTFWDKWEESKVGTSSRPFIITDDNDSMFTYGYSWTNGSARSCSRYPKLVRLLSRGTDYYSLNFGKPSIGYNDQEKEFEDKDSLTGGETLYARFWRGYLVDRFSEENKVMTCYVDLNLSDIQRNLFNKFIYINDSIWVINKIIGFDPVSKATTKVEFVSVQNVQAYISQDYIKGNLIIQDESKEVLFDHSGALGSSSLPVLIRTNAFAKTIDLTITATTDWSVENNAEEGSSINVRDDVLSITIPENKSNNVRIYNIDISWSGTVTQIQILQVSTWLVTAKGNPSSVINAMVNGGASANVADGGEARFNSSSNRDEDPDGVYDFAYWIINDEYYFGRETLIDIYEATEGEAFWYDKTKYVKLECTNEQGVDEYTSIEGVSKIGHFWLLEIGKNYKFRNTQGGFTGYRFSGDNKYTKEAERVITEEDTLLQVYYNKVLINVNVTNYSEDYILDLNGISVAGNTLNFQISPDQTDDLMIALDVFGEISIARFPYHFLVIEDYIDITKFGIYNLVLHGHNVGWIGDNFKNLDKSGEQTFEMNVFGPVEYSLIASEGVILSEYEGNSDKTIEITIDSRGGERTVVQKIGDFEYKLIIYQPAGKPIGWKGLGIRDLRDSLESDSIIYNEKFYHNGAPIFLSSGLSQGSTEVEPDGSKFSEITATFDKNKFYYPNVLVFEISCESVIYTLQLTQKAAEQPQYEWWGQIPDENGIVKGKIGDTGSICPEVTDVYDLGAEDLKYRKLYAGSGEFVDVQATTVTASQFHGNASSADRVNGELSITQGSNVQKFDGSSDVGIVINEIDLGSAWTVYPSFNSSFTNGGNTISYGMELRYSKAMKIYIFRIYFSELFDEEDYTDEAYKGKNIAPYNWSSWQREVNNSILHFTPVSTSVRRESNHRGIIMLINVNGIYLSGQACNDAYKVGGGGMRYYSFTGFF